MRNLEKNYVHLLISGRMLCKMKKVPIGNFFQSNNKNNMNKENTQEQ